MSETTKGLSKRAKEVIAILEVGDSYIYEPSLRGYVWLFTTRNGSPIKVRSRVFSQIRRLMVSTRVPKGAAFPGGWISHSNTAISVPRSTELGKQIVAENKAAAEKREDETRKAEAKREDYLSRIEAVDGVFPGLNPGAWWEDDLGRPCDSPRILVDLAYLESLLDETT